MLVPAGGLSHDHTEWISSGKKFFLPVKVLSKIYRGIYFSMLNELIDRGQIMLPDGTDQSQIKKLVYQKAWNVYCKKSMASPHSVVQYLGRYTHRVAISNQRIRSFSSSKVAFSYKNYRKRLTGQVIALQAMDFIKRFLRHILPTGFYKIRYSGILACCNNKTLQICHQIIGSQQHVAILHGLTAQQVYAVVSGNPTGKCKKCQKGQMKTILEIPPG